MERLSPSHNSNRQSMLLGSKSTSILKLHSFPLFLVLLPLITIRGLVEYSDHLIVQAYRILSVVCSMFVFVKYLKAVSRVTLLIIGHFCYLMVIGIMYNTNGVSAFLRGMYIRNIAVVSICILIDIFLKLNVFKTVRSLFWSLLLVCFINILYSLSSLATDIYRSGTRWLLGNRNDLSAVYFLLFAIAVLYYTLFKSNKAAVKIAYFLGIFNVMFFIVIESGGQLVGAFFILLFTAYYGRKGKHNYNIIIFGTVTIVLLNILIVFFNIQYLFSYIIVSLLKKDITLTRRTPIWDVYIVSFFDYFILGKGYNFLFIPFLLTEMHPHNALLCILYTGGLVSVAINMTIFRSVFKKLHKYRSNVVRISFFAVILAFLLNGVSSSLDNLYILYPLFVVISNPEVSHVI